MSPESTQPDNVMELQLLRARASSDGGSHHEPTTAFLLPEGESLAEDPDNPEHSGHGANYGNHDVGDAQIDHDANIGLLFEPSSQGETTRQEAIHEEVIHGEIIHGKVVYGEIDHEDVAHEGVADVVEGSPVNEITPNDDVVESAGHSDSEDDVKPTWRPTWLRSEVIATFTGIFLAITIAIPVLLWYSEHKEGIIKSHEKLVYVWRFGPTAVLTLVAAFWGRVELQAMRYAPYMALNAHGQSLSEEDYALDYMSMSFPKAIVHSIKRKHHLVYLTAIVSLFLKAQTALVSGLFGLADDPNSRVDVKILSSFNISGKVPPTSHENVFYIAQGVQNFDLRYPFGVTESITYQTFELKNDRAGRLRGSPDAPLKVFVDGLQSEFQCLKLENYSATISMDIDKVDDTTLAEIDMDLRFSGCGSVLRGHTFTYFKKGRFRTKFMEQGNTRNESQACSELPQQDKQFMIITGVAERSDDNLSAKVTSAAGVICSLSSWVSIVEVVDDGTSPTVTPLPEQPRLAIDADIWKMITDAVPSEPMGFLNPFGRARTIVLENHDTDLVESVFYDSNALSDTIESYASNMSSLVGHYFLRQQANYTIEASRFVPLSKLKVTLEVSCYITAISATTSIIAAYVTYTLHKRNRHNSAWLRNPTTVLGSFLLLHGQKPSSCEFHSSPGTFSTASWTKGKFSPVVVRYWIQALVAAWIVNTMYWLIFNQRHYDVTDRLSPIRDGEEGRILLLWTFATTSIMLSVSLYANARNTAHRSLCTLWALTSRTCSSREIDQSLLDMLGIRAFYKSIRLRIYSVALTQLLAFACGLLPTLSSVLLSIEGLTPEVKSHRLRQSTRFTAQRINWTLEDIFSLEKTVSVLLTLRDNNNLTYPNNTYEDLVFPILTSNHADESETIYAEALVPAAKLEPTCHRISDVEYDLSPDTGSLGGLFQVLSIFNLVKQPFTCPNGSQIYPEDIAMRQMLRRPGNSTEYMYIGTRFTSPLAECMKAQEGGANITQYFAALSEHSNRTSMTIFHIWGAYSWAQNDLESLFVWRCDYVWARINTQVSLVFIDDRWAIDSTKPPVPDLKTSKPWSPSFNVFELIYQDLYPGSLFGPLLAEDDVPRAFQLLLQPYGNTSLEAFRNPEEQENILRGLNRNIGIAAAQTANIYSRTHINETSESMTESELPEVTAIISHKVRYRLAQSTSVTYTIIGILSAVLLANLWSLISTIIRRFGRAKQSYLLDMEVEGLAPEGFGSLEAMASLVRASNIPSFSPQDAKSMSSKELHVALSGLGFRMGWFESRKELETHRHFTVGVLEDEDFEFLGSKEEIKGEDMLESQELATERRRSGDGAEQRRRTKASLEVAEEVPEELTPVTAGARPRPRP